MSKNKAVWEVHLRPNALTKVDDRDCIADVYKHAATKRNEDVADAIVKERSEFRRETILSILSLRDKAVKGFIKDGLSFMDELVQISPRVLGLWETEAAEYDEKEHKRTVDVVPTADFRAELDEVTIKVLGPKEAAARITAITDSATGLKDGTLTIGDDIIIEGHKLKIDESDPEQGVFFAMEDGTMVKTVRRLSVNMPKRIVARMPKELAEGAVTVIVKTRYTTSPKPLKTLREIVFNYPCTAKA